MPKYFVVTYGCQMNKSDSERIATLLERKGYQKAQKPEGADLVVINVCSVRQKPVDKIKNQILKIKMTNQNAKIVLTGCILSQDKKMFKKMGVEIKNFKEIENISPTLAFVPITKGCNNFCTYCAVPYTKGPELHRSVQKITAEVKTLIKKGHKEIMLLGQNVNSYPDFVGLLQKITALTSDFKIKFITNHPKDFSDELIAEMAKNPKIAKYVHLPIQSGDNEILKKMNRRYTRQQYLKLIEKIKKAIPGVEVTTDVIVGFPGETKKQFEKTVEVVKKVGFSQIYIGKYSPRAGTAAFLLKDNVPMEEKQRREQILRKLLVKQKPCYKIERSAYFATKSTKLIVIVGPTATGKTSLAVKLARKFNGEIVSADSRQIYKQIDIGTAKPTKKEREGVPHYLLDITTPDKTFSVAEYQKLATEKINEITAKGKMPFLVGGTAFYIYAVVEGWQFPEMKTNQKLRKGLEKKSLTELIALLKKLDPERTSDIDVKNKRRLIRAIEIAKTLGYVPKLDKKPLYDVLILGIQLPKPELEKRIAKRTNKMLGQGLEKEVKNLVKKYGFNSVLKETIGYSEWLKHWKELSSFPGRSLAPLIQKIGKEIKTNTRKFAKRQMTWFKRDKSIRWIKTQTEAEKLIEEFLNH